MKFVLIAAAIIAAPNSQIDKRQAPDEINGCETGSQLNPATLAYLRSTPVAEAHEHSGLGGYVRILARYTPCPVLEKFYRDYKNEKRDMIHRFFMHKLVNKSLNVNVSVRPLGVSATKTLIQIGRDSGKQGENWATDVSNTLNILPYFRVEPNTTLNLEATYLSNRSYLSSIASDTLDVLDRATTLITPTTPLITASNKARFNDASTFVDSTINGLLKVEIKETLRLDAELMEKSHQLAAVTLYTTGANDPYSRNLSENPRPVGHWLI